MTSSDEVEYAPEGALPASEDFPIFVAAISHFFEPPAWPAPAVLAIAP